MKKVILSVALAAALVAAIIGSMGVGGAKAQSGGGFTQATFLVTPLAGTTFDTSALPTGSFTAQGTLAGLQGGVGDFYRTGTKLPSGVVIVNDAYVSRDFNGGLFTTAVINPPILDGIHFDQECAVTGGTGTYKGAFGQMTLVDKGNGSFKAIF